MENLIKLTSFVLIISISAQTAETCPADNNYLGNTPIKTQCHHLEDSTDSIENTHASCFFLGLEIFALWSGAVTIVITLPAIIFKYDLLALEPTLVS